MLFHKKLNFVLLFLFVASNCLCVENDTKQSQSWVQQKICDVREKVSKAYIFTCEKTCVFYQKAKEYKKCIAGLVVYAALEGVLYSQGKYTIFGRIFVLPDRLDAANQATEHALNRVEILEGNNETLAREVNETRDQRLQAEERQKHHLQEIQQAREAEQDALRRVVALNQQLEELRQHVEQIQEEADQRVMNAQKEAELRLVQEQESLRRQLAKDHGEVKQIQDKLNKRKKMLEVISEEMRDYDRFIEEGAKKYRAAQNKIKENEKIADDI